MDIPQIMGVSQIIVDQDMSFHRYDIDRYIHKISNFYI